MYFTAGSHKTWEEMVKGVIGGAAAPHPIS